MAKATGPLFSLSASGGFGGALVFGQWKGRPTVRQLKTPANPRSTDQENSRNKVRVAAAGQKWANGTALVRSGETLTDKGLLQAAAPSGQAWNGHLVKSEIGSGDINYTAAATAYAALGSTPKTAWDTAAAGLTPIFPAVNQTIAGGTSTTPMSGGEAFFHYQYGLYVAGVADLPDDTPPTYA